MAMNIHENQANVLIVKYFMYLVSRRYNAAALIFDIKLWWQRHHVFLERKFHKIFVKYV